MNGATPLNAWTTHEPPAKAASLGRDAVGGGEMMRLMVEAAFASASHHSPARRFIVVKADSFEFRHDTGACVAAASVVFVGRSSLTVSETLGEASQPAASGHFMLVAVDDGGRPVPISQDQTPEEIRS